MSKPRCLVYFVSYRDGEGALSGTLVPTWDNPFSDPPFAVGSTEEEVLVALEARLLNLCATDHEILSRFLWTETFEIRPCTVDVYPQAARDGKIVVGTRPIPLRLSYAFAKTEGGYRIVLPRFGWRMVVEDLETAPEILRNALSAALLGEGGRTLFDYRKAGNEYIKPWSPRLLREEDDQGKADDDDEERAAENPALYAASEELVGRTARGKMGVLVAGPPESDLPEEIMKAVSAEPPRSILLCGGPGTGKTALVRRLARLFLYWRRQADRPKKRIFATTADRLVAGMVYLGMWQERCLRIISELSFSGDYLYVDRLADLARAQSDGSSLAELLLPAAQRGEIALLAECGPEELERLGRKLPALHATFRVVQVRPESAALMPARLEDYLVRTGHKVRIHPQGLKRLVQHLAAYQPGCFPGKGYRFVDWLAQEERGKILYGREISVAFSRYSGLPVELIADEHAVPKDAIFEKLRQRVIGQDQACIQCARVLGRFKAGLQDPERPIGTLLFVGPTGVGKTELAKQLARYLFSDERRMIRCDMSEYMLPGSAQRLLAPEEGSLATQVRAQPLSLILLDEIEKAHPEVFDLLLSVLGEGRLSDTLGRLVDFRGALLIMTSNLGTTDTGKIGVLKDGTSDYHRAVREHFRPELVGRIDHIVTFSSLSQEDVLRIVELEIAAAAARQGLRRRGVTLEVSQEAREYLARRGYDARYGARPLSRLIEEEVIAGIATRLTRDPTLRDCTFQVRFEGTGLRFSV